MSDFPYWLAILASILPCPPPAFDDMGRFVAPSVYGFSGISALEIHIRPGTKPAKAVRAFVYNRRTQAPAFSPKILSRVEPYPLHRPGRKPVQTLRQAARRQWHFLFHQLRRILRHTRPQRRGQDYHAEDVSRHHAAQRWRFGRAGFFHS